MLEKIFLKAYRESLAGVRKGDKPEETESLKKAVLDGTIGVVTDNDKKFTAFKNSFSLFGIEKLEKIEIETDSFDLTSTPALLKANVGRFISNCDFFVARGRLGLPGSGAMTVLVDSCGNIISAVTSLPHHFTNFSVETAIFFDLFRLLKRIGILPQHKGITDKTKTVYSSKTFIDVYRSISLRKFEPLSFLKGKTLLILGGYLDGIFLAEFFKDTFEKVYLYDKEESVLSLSTASLPDIDKFDVILDLTGFGGAEVKNGKVGKFKGDVIICENPSGRRKFKLGKECDYELVMTSDTAKTSGTMTISVSLLREVTKILEDIEGVFYAVPNFLFAESLLFNLKSSSAFLDFLDLPVVTVSAVKESPISTKTIDSEIERLIEGVAFEVRKV